MCKVFFVESDKSTQTIMKAWKIRGIFGNLKELGGIKNERKQMAQFLQKALVFGAVPAILGHRRGNWCVLFLVCRSTPFGVGHPWGVCFGNAVLCRIFNLSFGAHGGSDSALYPTASRQK